MARSRAVSLTMGPVSRIGRPVRRPEDSGPSAFFLPPTANESLYGRNERAATLMLYVEPRTADGHVPPASDLPTWSRRFTIALAAPRAFADFLSGDLGLATSNPAAQCGIRLQWSPVPHTGRDRYLVRALRYMRLPPIVVGMLLMHVHIERAFSLAGASAEGYRLRVPRLPCPEADLAGLPRGAIVLLVVQPRLFPDR
jgi:hypothetical protein